MVVHRREHVENAGDWLDSGLARPRLRVQVEGNLGMSTGPNPRRQPDLYWKQMEQLKAASVCIRLIRNRLARWVRGVELVRALASSGSIAAWAWWKDYPLVWGGIIAAAQVLDATKQVFPFTRTHKAASDLTVALELLFIDTQLEWERIYTGRVPEEAIMDRCAKLRKLQLEAERKHFPEGFRPSQKLIQLATEETRDYFLLMYPEDQAQ
jgi:hypothetical protein